MKDSSLHFRMLWVLLALPVNLVAAEGCKVEKVAVLPIVMEDSAPVLDAKINGKPVQFVLDSGAYFSILSRPLAQSLALKVSPGSPAGVIWTRGVSSGAVDMQMTTAAEFEFAGIKAKNIEFLVGGNAIGGHGILANNLLGSWDVEYDLANGRVSLLRISGCENANLAYWKTVEQSNSVMEFSSRSGREKSFRQVIGVIYMNDQRMRAMLDTGAHGTVVTLAASARAGVHSSSPGALPAKPIVGIGLGGSKSWQAPFASIKLGNNEEIKNTRVRIADFSMGDDVDLLLGADFFLSHHVLVARSLQKVFITYNGGRVFNIGTGEGGSPSEADESADPESLARRAAASLSRREYDSAAADLSKAIELDPGKPEYYFRRAEVAIARNRPSDALPDLDQALQHRTDFMPAMMPRAEARMSLGDVDGAVSDLDTFDRLAGRGAFERLHLGNDYLRAGRYELAIRQYDTWLDAYQKDNGMVNALQQRCLARALAGLELDKAMTDCNHALSFVDRQFASFRDIYATRGLVWLRQRNYDKALSDFDSTLKVDAKNPYALYGRGVARSKKGQGGTSDIDAAREESAPTVQQLVAAGIAP